MKMSQRRSDIQHLRKFGQNRWFLTERILTERGESETKRVREWKGKRGQGQKKGQRQKNRASTQGGGGSWGGSGVRGRGQFAGESRINLKMNRNSLAI